MIDIGPFRVSGSETGAGGVAEKLRLLSKCLLDELHDILIRETMHRNLHGESDRASWEESMDDLEAWCGRAGLRQGDAYVLWLRGDS